MSVKKDLIFGGIADRLLAQSQLAQAAMDPFEKFARERLWVRDKSGGVVQFKLKSIQRKYEQIKERAIRAGKPRKFILLKYRRGGFTTLEQGKHYQLCVTKPHTWVATLAHSNDSTGKISQIPKLFRKRDTLIPPEKRDDRVSLHFPHTDSTFHIGTAGGKSFGRGDTLQRVHGSEVAFWCEGPNQFHEVDNLVAGLTEATSHGEIVLESTPNGVNWFCIKFREARAGLNDWTPIFLPWFEDADNVYQAGEFDQQEILDTITEEESLLVARHRLTMGQLAWRRAKRLSLGRLFKQEYPEDPDTCFLTSGTAFFDLQVVMDLLEGLDSTLKAIKELPEGKVFEEHVPGGTITYVEKPKEGDEYCIGADASEGLPTSDPCAGGVRRKRDGAQVAWVHGRFRPEVFARHLADIGYLYNRALIGVEKNNHGHSVLNTLDNVIQYPNLFYSKNEKGEPGPGKSGKLGWETTPATRPLLLDELEEEVRTNCTPIRDRGFLQECTTFKLQPSGKYEADAGAHDDKIISWGIAKQMCKYSRHRARVIILE